MNDMEILRRAYERENDTRDRRAPHLRSWEFYSIGATKSAIRRLVDDGLVCIALKTDGFTRYKLTDKGRGLVGCTVMEREKAKIPAGSILEAMDLVVGFEDIKMTLAQSVSARRRTHFMLEGPPACAKSLMLEGLRAAVPDAYIVFGSRTSAAGLSNALFEQQPGVLLMDEADKMENDVFSVLLGLMESGEVIETKSKSSRGVKLETMVVAACNSSAKMPPEFLSRFALHVQFPAYTRQEFLDVCHGFLTRAEGCDQEIALKIGAAVWDYGLGDVRKARAVWQLMTDSTEEEMRRVIRLMLKYIPETYSKRQRANSKDVPQLPLKI
ncbi:MAG: ATP-binding protein [Chloroflexota bacterium]